MARYDNATNEFMDAVSDAEVKPSPTGAKFIARQAMGLAKDLKKPSKAAVEAAIAKRVMSLATKTSLRQMEKQAGVSPLALYKTLNDHYKADWHDWEPETLWKTLVDDDLTTEPQSSSKNLIQALQVVAKTNFAFEDLNVFEKVGHAFNGNPVFFDAIQPLEPNEVAYTHQILHALRPKEDYEDELYTYMAACFKEAGMVYADREFVPKEVQEHLDQMENNLELKDQVVQALSNGAPYDPESMLGVQLERNNEIREYLEERL